MPAVIRIWDCKNWKLFPIPLKFIKNHHRFSAIQKKHSLPIICTVRNIYFSASSFSRFWYYSSQTHQRIRGKRHRIITHWIGEMIYTGHSKAFMKVKRSNFLWEPENVRHRFSICASSNSIKYFYWCPCVNSFKFQPCDRYLVWIFLF